MISIIVPVYKVEKYLDKCVLSLVSQTYRDIEIILVDDGSPDECGKMCDEWAKKDARIKVVHRKNGGLSAARNSGLDVAKGDYIGFIDSDDYVDENMFSHLFDAMQKHNADIGECAYIKVNENETDVKCKESEEVLVFSNEEAMEELLRERHMHQVVWNKLYKKEVIGTLRFKEGKINEDEFFTYRAVGNSKCVVSLYSELYFYVQHENSIMSSSYSVKRLDAIEALKERKEYMKEKFPELYPLAQASYLGACLYAHQCLTRYSEADKDKTYRKELARAVRNEKIGREVYACMQGKTPIFMRMFKLLPDFTSVIRNKLGVGL